MFSFLGGSVAEITVEYADYVIARGFLEAFEEWVKGCKCTPKSALLASLRRVSHWTPTILQVVVASLVIFFSLRSIPGIFVSGADQAVTARFAVVFAGGAYLLLKLAHIAGEFIEATIDSFPEISFLKLNKGDERLIEEAARAKPFALLRLALAASATVVLGVISSKLERLL